MTKLSGQPESIFWARDTPTPTGGGYPHSYRRGITYNQCDTPCWGLTSFQATSCSETGMPGGITNDLLMWGGEGK